MLLVSTLAALLNLIGGTLQKVNILQWKTTICNVHFNKIICLLKTTRCVKPFKVATKEKKKDSWSVHIEKNSAPQSCIQPSTYAIFLNTDPPGQQIIC